MMMMIIIIIIISSSSSSSSSIYNSTLIVAKCLEASALYLKQKKHKQNPVELRSPAHL
jgi:hypothetical protein